MKAGALLRSITWKGPLQILNGSIDRITFEWMCERWNPLDFKSFNIDLDKSNVLEAKSNIAMINTTTWKSKAVTNIRSHIDMIPP